MVTHSVLLPMNANIYQGYTLKAAKVAAINKHPVLIHANHWEGFFSGFLFIQYHPLALPKPKTFKQAMYVVYISGHIICLRFHASMLVTAPTKLIGYINSIGGWSAVTLIHVMLIKIQIVEIIS